VCDGNEDVTKRVTPVTTPRDVPRTVAPSKLAAAEAEIAALTAEVAHLKRKLAEAGGGKPKPLTAAERKRNQRAKAKQS